MTHPVIKTISAGTLAIIGVLCTLVGYTFYFPPTYDARVRIAPGATVIAVQIAPIHPFLAEYDRTLVLHKDGVPDRRIKMFPDTGGYLRTQLYLLPDGTMLVSGFFDAFRIQPARHALTEYDETRAGTRVYLGAFDKDPQHVWRFIPAGQSAEKELVAGGG